MLSLKIGNTYIETSGIEIPVTLRSPLFSMNDNDNGSFIFNFSLPATDALKNEFGYFHRPGRYGQAFVRKSLTLKFGPLQFSGTAKIVKADNNIYEISCPVDNGNLAQLFKSKKLNEVDLGGVRETILTQETVDASTEANLWIYTQTASGVTLYDLAFTNITANPGSILDSSGLVITAVENSKLILRVKFDFDKTYGTAFYLLFFKNGTEFKRVQIDEGSFECLAATDVVTGDLITWKIEATPEAYFSYQMIEFVVSAGANLTVYPPGSLNLNKGLSVYPGDDYATFPLENAKMFDNIEDDAFSIDHKAIKVIYSKYFPVLNYYANNRFPVHMYGEVEGESFLAFNLFNPFPYLAYVMKKVFADFQIIVTDNIFEDSDLRQLVIFNLFAENNYSESNLIKPAVGFNLQDHVPDTLISDFFKHLCRLFGIGFSYKSSTKELKFKYLDDIIKDNTKTKLPGTIISSPVLTAETFNGYKLEQNKPGSDEYINTYFKSLSGLTMKGSVSFINQLPSAEDSEINDCYYVTTRKEYWVYNYDTELSILNWIFHSKDFEFTKESIDTEISDLTLSLKSDINAIMMNNWDLLDHNICALAGREWLIPVTMQPGNFDALSGVFKSEFTKSLLFYHGLRNDSDGFLYPLASNDVFDFAGNQISFESTDEHPAYTQELSLKWNGDSGLWERKHKNWVTWRVNNPGFFTVKAVFTPHQLASLDWFKWYDILNHNFIIEEIRFIIYESSLSETELDVRRK